MNIVRYCYIAGIFFILLCIIPSIAYAKAVTQEGMAYLYNFKSKSKTPLAGVSFSVVDAEPTKSDNNGHFTLNFLTLKRGSKITNVRQPFFKGLKVFNKKTVDNWYIVDGKLELIMCDYEEFELVKKTYYELGRKSSEQKYAKQKEKLEEALRQGRLRENDYEQQLQELRENYEHIQDELSNSADAMACIDQSEISRQVQDVFSLYEQGEVDKAMEMLSSLRLAEGLEQAIIRKERSRKEFQNAAKDSIMAVENIRSAIQLCYNSAEWDKVERYRWLLANKVGTPDDIFAYAYFCSNQIEYKDSVIPYYKRVMDVTNDSRCHHLPHLYLYATAAYNIGCVYQARKQIELAKQYLKIGIEERKRYARQSTNPNDEGHVAWALVGMASGEMNNGNFNDAKRNLRKAEDIYERIVKLNSDEHSWALGRLHAYYGDWFSKQDMYDEAEIEYTKAMTMFKDYIDAWPTEYLTYIKYAFDCLLSWSLPSIMTQVNLHKLERTKMLLNDIYSYYQKTPLKDAAFKKETAIRMEHIADYLIQVGMFKQAEEMATYAIAIDSTQNRINIILAQAFLHQYNYKKAKDIYLEDIELLNAIDLGNLSYCLIFVKDFPFAERIALKGLASDPSQHWIVTNLAASVLFQGRFDEARLLYQKYEEELKNECLTDFKKFEEAGIIPKERETDVERIKKLLQEE